MGDYRPTVDDFRPTKTQQLSCRDAGQFDIQFQGRATTGWTAICQDRAKRGINRKTIRAEARRAS